MDRTQQSLHDFLSSLAKEKANNVLAKELELARTKNKLRKLQLKTPTADKTMGKNSCLFSYPLWAFVIFLNISSGTSAGNLWNFQRKDYKDHVCNRPCEEETTPRLCHYDFLVENYYVMSRACYNCPYNQSDCLLPHCVTAGGVNRVIKTANRLLPGPAIEVCEGDTIEVKVTNKLDGGEGTTIHWHGILQRGSQHMDGTSMVTQCPILIGSHFTYKFQAAEVGTYFWHGHAGTQRADGLSGPLIVRQSLNRELHRSLYDFDLSEHVIMVTDWLTVNTEDRLAELVQRRENLHMTILINGKGQFKEYQNQATNMPNFTPRAEFIVKPGFRYRFRVINSGTLNCPLQLSIDNHTLWIIASDGSPVQPLQRDSFTIYAGERYDFVLAAKNSLSPRNYWIRARGLNSCTKYYISQTAILKYDGAPDVLPPESTKWDVVTQEMQAPYTDGRTDEVPVIQQLQSLAGPDGIVTSTPDRKIFLDVDMVNVENLRASNSPYYPLESSALFESPQINYITSFLPPAPPLTQLKDLPQDTFCNAETVQDNCQEVWCTCVHLYQINLGDLVELIVLDDDHYHAMHLHGHKFRLVGTGQLEDGTSLDELKRMDYRGKLNRTTGRAPLKDTAAATIGGYSILRFKADNPGFWLFHCHLEFHAESGMHMIFQVGNSTQLPRRPNNFPTCGSFDFVGFENNPSSGGPNPSVISGGQNLSVILGGQNPIGNSGHPCIVSIDASSHYNGVTCNVYVNPNVNSNGFVNTGHSIIVNVKITFVCISVTMLTIGIFCNPWGL